MKDPKESGRCFQNTSRNSLANQFIVKFYEHLGMKMIRKIEQPEAKFDLYFMGKDSHLLNKALLTKCKATTHRKLYLMETTSAIVKASSS